jgi:hypothetical protein
VAVVAGAVATKIAGNRPLRNGQRLKPAASRVSKGLAFGEAFCILA